MKDLIKIENINNYDDKFYKDFLETIKKEKKDSIKKVVNKKEKYRRILGEFLLYSLLKDYGINYDDVIIKYNDYGKPLIDNYKLFYNISHKEDYSVCILTDKNVGIDIENIKALDNKVLNYIAAGREKEFIKTNDDFTLLYTLKEAYYKMKGIGVGDFKDIEFYISKDKIESNQKIDIKSIRKDNYIISIIKDAC